MMVKCREVGFLQGAKSVVFCHWGVLKVRKAIAMLVVVCTAAAGVLSGVAAAAGPSVGGKKCGTKYTPGCKHHTTTTKPAPTPTPPAKPSIKTPKVTPKCTDTGATYRVPTVTFTAAAGIRRIQVREGSRTIKLLTFSGHRTNYPLRGLTVRTAGLVAGGHQLSFRITDAKGRSASKTLRFSVCVGTPVFTG